jgi:hypothetical protein
VTLDRWRSEGAPVPAADDPELIGELEDVRAWQQSLRTEISSSAATGLRFLSFVYGDERY